MTEEEIIRKIQKIHSKIKEERFKDLVSSKGLEELSRTITELLMLFSRLENQSIAVEFLQLNSKMILVSLENIQVYRMKYDLRSKHGQLYEEDEIDFKHSMDAMNYLLNSSLDKIIKSTPCILGFCDHKEEHLKEEVQ